MALCYHDAHRLWEARMRGAAFGDVLTVGRLSLHLHPAEVARLRRAYKAAFPEAADAGSLFRKPPLQGDDVARWGRERARDRHAGFLGAARRLVEKLPSALRAWIRGRYETRQWSLSNRRFYKPMGLVLVALLTCPAAMHAQDSGVRSERRATEWMAIAGAARAQSLFNSVTDRTVVTTAFGHGWFLNEKATETGRPVGVEAIIEVVPTLFVRQSTTVWGFGLTPVFFRWNFDTGSNVTPFTELAGGYLFTSEPVPEEASRALFTAHIGAGVRLRIGEHGALMLGYRLHHISNGETADPNPGLNSHMGYVGLSFFRR